MTNQPKVSIIVPTYNSSATLGECLQSIKEQTYTNIEIIVVDNNSKDDTKEVAKKFTSKVFNKGPERCTQRNYGVEQSTGKYVAIIDSDMNLSKEVMTQCVEQMQHKGIVGVVIPEESFGKGFWAQCKKLERSFYVGVSWMEAARFFKKSDFTKIGGYDEDMVSGEDWDFSQRMQKHGTIGRIQAYIYHNEGHISLYTTVKKKFYYAQKFAKYTAKASEHSEQIASQTSIVARYKMFLSKPVMLFKNPIYGVGMLFMKTMEFGFGGVGLLVGKFKK
jgi:glycosyltransferase involved in cell wall biosynthesis